MVSGREMSESNFLNRWLHNAIVMKRMGRKRGQAQG